jgi:hypothetical protein
MKISSKNESTNQPMQSLSELHKAWQEAVADDTEGLDPEPVFDRLETTYSDKRKRLGALETPGFVLSESFNEPMSEDELQQP